MTAFHTIGLIGKRGDPRAVETLNAVATYLVRKRDAGELKSVLMPVDNVPAVSRLGVDFESIESIATKADLAIVVGGDGTLLSAGRVLAPHGIPILGINQGRLGFMVDIRPEDMTGALDALLNGEGVIDERLVLSARVHRADGSLTASMLAINDVVVRNQAAIRMLEFQTWLGDEFISDHRADGLIVSTPTGSTAYALSSGGPVLHPYVPALAMVPICPHTLSDRPIVVPLGTPIRIVFGEAAGATMTCDGQNSEILNPGDTVEINSSESFLRLIHPRGYSYFELLRDKLHWGRSPAGVADKS